jgi:hypothetical protein
VKRRPVLVATVASASSLAAAAACTAIPPAADFAGLDAGADAAADVDTDSAASRCFVVPPHFASPATARIAVGDAPGTELVVVQTAYDEPRDGGTELVSYDMVIAGTPATLAVGTIVDLASPHNADLSTCAYCAFALAPCTLADSGAAACGGEYRPVAGSARVVELPTEAGVVWVDLANVEFARETSRTGFAVAGLDRADCIYAERLTMQAFADRGLLSCTGGQTQIVCDIGNTASRRTP